jgi:predicted nucleic acid-binding protein
MNGEFVDTNILVYAHDSSASKKFETARALIQRLLDEKRGLLSVQVLMEFYVTVTRKLTQPLPDESAEAILEDLSTWRVFAPSPSDVMHAVRISRTHRISLWDAMIVHAAESLGAGVLWSEDLSDGQSYGSVTVRNPFKMDPEKRHG